MPRHPSRLYEAALEGLVLFAVLFVLARNPAVRRRPGISAAFLIGYGTTRFMVEFACQLDGLAHGPPHSSIGHRSPFEFSLASGHVCLPRVYAGRNFEPPLVQTLGQGQSPPHSFYVRVRSEGADQLVAPLPDDLAWVEDPGTGERHGITPGALRRRDVAVGRHVPVSPGAVPRFLAAFERAYAPARRPVEALLLIPAAHHRVLWIHPFLDRNGRIARLMTHAMLTDALGAAPLWSVSRALARRVADYQAHLGACDLPRRNDLDGRGNLSAAALAAFTAFVLRACLEEARSIDPSAVLDETRAAGRAQAGPDPAAGGLLHGTADGN